MMPSSCCDSLEITGTEPMSLSLRTPATSIALSVDRQHTGFLVITSFTFMRATSSALVEQAFGEVARRGLQHVQNRAQYGAELDAYDSPENPCVLPQHTPRPYPGSRKALVAALDYIPGWPLPIYQSEPQPTAEFLASCFATKPEAGAFEQMLVVSGMMPLVVTQGVLNVSGAGLDEALAKSGRMLVTHGAKDLVTQPTMSTRMQALNQEAQIALYPESAHAPFYDEPDPLQPRVGRLRQRPTEFCLTARSSRLWRTRLRAWELLLP